MAQDNEWWKNGSTQIQSAGGDWWTHGATPVDAQPPTGGTASDLAKSLKAGVQRLPGMATGLADLPFALAAGARPFTKAADALGEATGFQPGKWADETKFSAGYEQGKKAVDEAWKDGSAGDIALSYLKNPGYTANQVAESLPGMVAGGVAGRALMGVGRIAAPAARAGGMGPAAPGLAERALGQWAAPVAAGVGEGAVTAGQQMAQYQGDDQQKNALASLGAGVGTGLIGVGAGRVANKLGLETAETAIAKAGTGAAKAADEVPLSAKRRILGGMVSEAVLQELPQSAQEQMWQNWADGKPLMEGVARAATEGAIAGGVMGAGANVSDGGAGKRRAQAEQQARQNAEAAAASAEALTQEAMQPPTMDTIAGESINPVDRGAPATFEDLVNPVPTPEPDPYTAWDQQAVRPAEPVAQDASPPSERMGIDPSAGPLSKAAATAVDAGTAAAPLASLAAQSQSTANAPANGDVLQQVAERAAQAQAAINSEANFPQSTTGEPNGAQAYQAQQAVPQPAQAGAAQAGAPAAQGLSNGSAPTLNTGAQAAPQAGPQAQAQGAETGAAAAVPVEAPRPSNWRTSMLGARPVANSLGIESKGKRLAQVVAEIDAADAQRAGTTGGAGQQAPSVAPQGREVSRDIGRYKEGLSEYRANQVRSDLARKNPGVVYTVEEDAALKNGYAVVGREPAPGAKWERAGPSAPAAGEGSPPYPKGQNGSQSVPLATQSDKVTDAPVAFVKSGAYLEKQEGRGAKAIWSGSEPRSAATGRQPPYAGNPEVVSGQDAPIARGENSKQSWSRVPVPADNAGAPSSFADQAAGNAGQQAAMESSQSDASVPPQDGGAKYARAEAGMSDLARAILNLPATKESVHAAVRQLVNGLGMLPNRLGRVVVATAAEIKQDWEPLIGPTGMEAAGDAGQAQGFYDPKTKTVFLVADHIKAGDEMGVVAHELMHKHGQAVLGEEGWSRLHGMIEGWAGAADGSMERRVYDEAAARVRDSRPEGADAVGYSSQELFPYAVQVALDMGVKPSLLAKPGTVARWLGQVRAALREVWDKITRKPDLFNAQDLVNLAFGIAQRENPEHRSELDGAISSMEREISMVIDAARQPGGHAPQKAALGTVSDWLAREARDKANLDLAGFSHVLDGSAVRHIIKNHFDEKTERSRGQLPVTEADLQALPSVVARPDRVVFGTQNRLKRDQVAYVKRMPDGAILYLEEVRTGRAELAAVSLRKYPATMNVETIVSTLHPNAQGDGGNALIVLTPPDAGNGPMFSRSAAAAPAADDYTPAQRRAAEHAFGVQKKQTWAERAQSFRANLGTKLRQGLVDQFAPLKEVSDKAYMLARMSKGSDGAVEAALLYGKVFLRDGVYDVDIKDGGFAKVLATLKGEDVRFFQWVAAQRAERLKAEGKENLLTDQDITALKSLNAGRFADGTPRMGVYAQALKELNAFNDSTLKVAMESGLIDQAAYDLMKDQPYVPFYRLMEDDGGMRGPRFSSGLVNQQAWKKLKGGTQQLNADLLQNTLMNWSHLYAAAARNRASLETMAAAEKLGIAYRVSADTKGAVKVMRDGVAEHWAVEDPYLLDAISAMSYTPPGIVKAMAPFKRLLTFGVTVNPTFKIRNLIRDSLSAIAQSDLSYNPAENVAKGWKATSKNSQTYASMLASGGIIKFGTQEDTNRVRAQIEKLGGQVLDKSGFERFKGQMKSLWEVYEEFGDRTENVNRAALYERLIAKGHSHAEASFMARDLMDFSMSGKWETVRFLAQTVPFLNARLQGLYKLGRAAKEDPRRFAAMAGAVSLASLGLLAAYGDDEDWKKREDWDRDNFWWFKVGDKAFRIPKPFEVGAIGTLAERTAELMLSDEMTGKRFGQRISDMVFNTFAMDPTPQAIKPFLDVYANKDSFSGRAIEGIADERLRPQDRYNERTSEVARLLGSWGLPDPVRLAKGEYQGLSPKQIDFLLRGYFGWLATVSTTTTDMLSRPLLDRGERPAMRLRDTFLAGNFVESLPTGSSRYVTAMYEQAKEVDQAWASHQAAIKLGDIELARSIQEEEGPKLRNRFAVANAKQQIAELGQQARKVEGDRQLSAEAKRARLDEIEARKNVIAQRVAVTH